MVHLPALTATGNISKVLEVINSFDMNIRGVYGEGSKSQGNIYQISNKKSCRFLIKPNPTSCIYFFSPKISFTSINSPKSFTLEAPSNRVRPRVPTA